MTLMKFCYLPFLLIFQNSNLSVCFLYFYLSELFFVFIVLFLVIIHCVYSPLYFVLSVLSFVSLCGHPSPVFCSTHSFIHFTCFHLVSPPPHTIYPFCLVSPMFPIVSRYPSVSVLFKPQCFSFGC